MKQIRVFFILILSTVLFSACNEEEDGFPIYYQNLSVAFVDDVGNNPITSLEFCDPKYPYVPLEPDISSPYAYNWVMDKYFMFYMNGENLNVGEGITRRLKVTWIDGTAYLNFQFANFYHEVPVVEMELTCEKIFGDNDRHVMVAEYDVEHFNEENQIECVRFTLDGVEYPVKAGGLVTVPLGK